MVTKSPQPKIKHPYITQKRGVAGDKPTIINTRIKVAQIAIEYEQMGWSPDDIIQARPHLTLAQVHDALAYYYEHAETINADIRQGEALIQTLQTKYPQSILEAKRGRTPHLHR